MSAPETLYCSFCGSSQDEVAKLIAGPAGVFICDRCVISGTAAMLDPRALPLLEPRSSVCADVACSFCRAVAKEAFGGNDAQYICAKCLTVGRDIILEESER